jgi:transcriptional regulator with XRE-family HTH domain
LFILKVETALTTIYTLGILKIMNKSFILKQQRNDLGLTQIELAEQLGVSNNTVARWENGRLPISRIVELAMQRLVSNHHVIDKIRTTVNQSESDNENLLTFADALSEFARIGKPKSNSSLRRYLKSEKLKGELVGREWQIKKSDFENFINSNFFKTLK